MHLIGCKWNTMLRQSGIRPQHSLLPKVGHSNRTGQSLLYTFHHAFHHRLWGHEVGRPMNLIKINRLQLHAFQASLQGAWKESLCKSPWPREKFGRNQNGLICLFDEFSKQSFGCA